jgi:DNA-binding transcriptional LysR family regulator
MSVDIRHLHYFSEVARHRSFTKAAAALHVSQPSLSKAIKSIEEQLGVPLFYRSSRQLELTDAGRAVLVNAKKVLDAFRNLTSELTDIMELKKGEIRIGIPPMMGAVFFSRSISRFKEAYPLVNITLTEVGTKIIQRRVEDGSLDIGLVCHVPMHKEEIESIELSKDPLMLIVHREHPLATRSHVRFDDLREEPFILYRNDFSLHDRIIEECAKHRFYPNVVCESSQKDFMVEMVEAKMGIALLPSKICERLHSSLIVSIPFERPSVFLELGMIWKKNDHVPFAVREFIRMAHEPVTSPTS